MGIKLLLADDSITIQKVVGIIFAGEDFQLAIVDNGDAALTKARETMPDVLLVDAVMPGRTGYEVCEEIRRDPSLRGVPILLLTGAFEPFDEEKARQCGADDFISKPFESQHLIDKVMSLAELGIRRKNAPPAPQPAVAPPPAVPPSPNPAPVASPSGPPPVAQPKVELAVPANAAQFAVEIVEATADDDLWGAFELEEMVEEDEAAGFGEASFAGEEASFDTGVVEEPFPFAVEPETAPRPAETAPQWGAVEEEAFAFEEIAGTEAFEIFPEEESAAFEEETGTFEIVPDEQFGVFEEDTATVFETVPAETEEFFVEVAEPAGTAFARVETPAPLAGPEFELQFAPEEEYVPVAEAIPAAAAPAAAPSGAAGELSLSEEQLTALVSRISRDILEKIAWEVVPDLAERIIREEIRKIKEGM